MKSTNLNFFNKKNIVEKSLHLKLILFLLTFLITSHFSIIGVDLHHHGIMFNGVMGVLSHSGKLYKDYYYHYGPLTPLFQAIPIYFFGAKLIVIQYFTCFIYSIISVQLFNLSRLLFNSKLSFISVLIWLLMAPYYLLELLPWSSIYAIPFFIIIIQLFIMPTKKYSYFFVGICVGIIFFIRQSSGLIAIVGLCLIIILNYRNIRFYSILFGLFIVMFLGFIVLYFYGILPSYFELCFIGQKFMIIQGGSNIAILIHFFKLLSESFLGDNWIELTKQHSIPYVPYCFNLFFIMFILTSLFYLFVRILKKNIHKMKFNLAVYIFCLVSLSQMFPVPCIRHYYFAFSPVIPIIFRDLYLFLKWFTKKHKVIGNLFSFFLITVLLANILIRLEIGYKRTIDLEKDYVSWNSANSNVLDGIFIPRDEFPFFNEIDKLNSKMKYLIKPDSPMPYLLPYVTNKSWLNNSFFYNKAELIKNIDSTISIYRDFGVYTPLNRKLFYYSNRNPK